MSRTATSDKTDFVKLGHRVPRELRDLLMEKSIREREPAEDLLSRYLARGLGRDDLAPKRKQAQSA